MPSSFDLATLGQFVHDLIATLGQFVHDLIAAHPILYTLIVVPLVLFLVRKFEAAIPQIADFADAYQEKALKRAGLSDEELAILEEHEAKDMRAAADELDKKAATRKLAAQPKLPLTPAT